MRGADFVEVALLGLAGCLVQDCDDAVDAGGQECFLDQIIVFACSDEREEVAWISLLVAFHNLHGGRGEVHLDYSRTFVFGLARNVLDACSVFRLDHVVLGEVEKVATPAVQPT